MSDLPDDPFLDPRWPDVPFADLFQKAAHLQAAFANINSFSGLMTSLGNADRRDVELVALLAITHGIRTAMDESAEAESEDLFEQWILRNPTTDPLDG